MTKICLVIKGPTLAQAEKQLQAAKFSADLVELRLDYFIDLNISQLAVLCSRFKLPMIFTLRSQQQGGEYQKTEQERQADLEALATLEPNYLDVEYHLPLSFIKRLQDIAPKTQLILSYHDFEKTPRNLSELFATLAGIPADWYKMAVTAQSTLDTLYLAQWARRSQGKLIAISMGPHGQLSRILAPYLQSPFTYASIQEDLATAPGQLTIKTLLEQYNFRSITPTTALFGLIGDPVDRSVSDITHNNVFFQQGLPAVYLKIKTKAEQLREVLEQAKQLPFKGLSVTMPLKEVILPYLDSIDPEALQIGAVNTLLIEHGKIHGVNTDGCGALNVIEQVTPVAGKRLVLIGSGGAAKSIAYEALRRNAKVALLSRDPAKAASFAQRLACPNHSLDQVAACLQGGYDILINCTPSPMPIDPRYILPQSIAMDIQSKPLLTPFLQQAQAKGCIIIPGYRMFVEQALGQFALWFQLPPDLIRPSLTAITHTSVSH